MSKKVVLLIDPPTFPKGSITLSLPMVAGVLKKDYTIRYLDLNLSTLGKTHKTLIKSGHCFFVGLKVCAQNYQLAIAQTSQIKKLNPDLPVIWGGEFAVLMPELCLQYADSVVSTAFENVADQLIKDLEQNLVGKNYRHGKAPTLPYQPDFSIIPNPESYSQAFGWPLETSRGCDRKCTFCLVHSMQPNSSCKSRPQLHRELKAYGNNFVNIVDYNLGVHRQHFVNLLEELKASGISGWMGELCLETLDDDDLLKKMAASRCRVVYCGLESIDETSLISINKAKTNSVAHYERIIRKVQSYGIQVAAGIIIGLPGSTAESITRNFNFFNTLGLLYVKITFLTYNPGTKVHESMKRVGHYVANNLSEYDGNHFTFLPKGLNRAAILESLTQNIRRFYALSAIKARAKALQLDPATRNWFIAMNLIYREPYLNWLKYDIFKKESGFNQLLQTKFKKSQTYMKAERLLSTKH